MAYLVSSCGAVYIGLMGGSFHIGVKVPLGFGVFLGFHTTTPEDPEAAAHQAHFMERRRLQPN